MLTQPIFVAVTTNNSTATATSKPTAFQAVTFTIVKTATIPLIAVMVET